MLTPVFLFGFSTAQDMWAAQLKLLRLFTGAFDQPERSAKEKGAAVNEFRTAATPLKNGDEPRVPEVTKDSIVRNKTASKKRALERRGKGTAKRTQRLSSSAKRTRVRRSHGKGR